MYFSKIKANMYSDDGIAKKMFIILILIGIQIMCASTNDSHSVVPENDYVLRSCMSSVELNRRNIDGSKTEWPIYSQRSRSRIANGESLPAVRSSSSQLRQTSRERSIGRRRPATKMIADTPLRTLNVERRGRDDPPQVFVKNNLLPEIRSSKLNGKSTKNEASIIVIESSSQIPFSRQIVRKVHISS